MRKNTPNPISLNFLYVHTVRGKKKESKVFQDISATNYRTTEIFFLRYSPTYEVFFGKNLEGHKFVCLPFFWHFLLLEGQKKAPKSPDDLKSQNLGVSKCHHMSRIFSTVFIYKISFLSKNIFEVGNFKKFIFSKNHILNFS